jgi:hypothetical protein
MGRWTRQAGSWPLAELLFGLGRTSICSDYPLFKVGLRASALAIWFFELPMATGHPRGQRLGDRWATTQLIRR